MRKFAHLFGRVGQGSKRAVEAFPLLLTVLISPVCYFVHNTRTKYNFLARFGRVIKLIFSTALKEVEGISFAFHNFPVSHFVRRATAVLLTKGFLKRFLPKHY